MLDIHTCTDADFENFLEPSSASKDRFERARLNGGIQCIDWKAEELELWGHFPSGNYAEIDIQAVPCHMG